MPTFNLQSNLDSLWDCKRNSNSISSGSVSSSNSNSNPNVHTSFFSPKSLFSKTTHILNDSYDYKATVIDEDSQYQYLYVRNYFPDFTFSADHRGTGLESLVGGSSYNNGGFTDSNTVKGGAIATDQDNEFASPRAGIEIVGKTLEDFLKGCKQVYGRNGYSNGVLGLPNLEELCQVEMLQRGEPYEIFNIFGNNTAFSQFSIFGGFQPFQWIDNFLTNHVWPAPTPDVDLSGASRGRDARLVRKADREERGDIL